MFPSCGGVGAARGGLSKAQVVVHKAYSLLVTRHSFYLSPMVCYLATIIHIICHPVAWPRGPGVIKLFAQQIHIYIMDKTYYVYILASSRNGTLYIGFTSNLAQRIFEHKNHLTPGFSSRYEVTKLVYVEKFNDVNMAIRHEKRLKEWKRNWKKDLIEKYNPDWRDLYEDIHQLV